MHKREMVACLVTSSTDGELVRTIRDFGTVTADIVAPANWLVAAGCTQHSIESPGVYGKPTGNVLEDQIQRVLAIAWHVKAVPGRTTDVRDGE